MARFLISRLAHGIAVLLGLSVIMFVLLRLLPGGPAQALLGSHVTPAGLAALNHEFGLDKPLPVQYLQSLWRLLHLDLGESYQQGRPVLSLIGENLGPTLLLTGTAVAISLAIAIPLGVYQASRRGSALDHGMTVAALVGYSVPVFWFGLILIMVFAINLGWFPVGGIVGPQDSYGDVGARVLHLALPAAMLSIAFVATWSRYIRSSMVDALLQDYIRTARARGVPERRLLFRHALPNGLIPAITLVGTSFPYMLSGSLITEAVFNYQGMGLLFWHGAQAKDFPLMMGTVVILGIATVVGSLVADLLNAVVDPRIRRSTFSA